MSGPDLLKMRPESSSQQDAPVRLIPTMEEMQKILEDQWERERLDRELKRTMTAQALQQAAASTKTKVAGKPNGPIVGPEEAKPRPGEVGDLLKAVIKIPAVEKALERLKQQASDKVQNGWKDLSGGGKAGVILSGAAITGTAIYGALGADSRRRKVYDLIRDRKIPIPIPKTPVTVEFKTGKEDMIMLKFDVMKLFR